MIGQTRIYEWALSLFRLNPRLDAWVFRLERHVAGRSRVNASRISSLDLQPPVLLLFLPLLATATSIALKRCCEWQAELLSWILGQFWFFVLLNVSVGLNLFDDVWPSCQVHFFDRLVSTLRLYRRNCTEPTSPIAFHSSSLLFKAAPKRPCSVSRWVAQRVDEDWEHNPNILVGSLLATAVVSRFRHAGYSD